jgi:RNA polymerase sigma-70 factor (ECF subfamily)
MAAVAMIVRWRRLGRREARHETQDDVPGGALPAMWDQLPVQRDLATLLGALPKAQQEAITLTKREGLSVVAASERSGVSVSTMRHRQPLSAHNR